MDNQEAMDEYIIGRSLKKQNQTVSTKRLIFEFLQTVNQSQPSTDTTDSDRSQPVENQYTPIQKHPPSPDMFQDKV